MSVRCSQRVNGEGKWGFLHQHQCTRAAKVERDGKNYCGVHDPIRIAEKRKESDAKWRREQDAHWKREILRNSASSLLQVLSELIEEVRAGDLVGCDHSAGICNCSMTFIVRKAEAVIRHAKGEESSLPSDPDRTKGTNLTDTHKPQPQPTKPSPRPTPDDANPPGQPGK